MRLKICHVKYYIDFTCILNNVIRNRILKISPCWFVRREFDLYDKVTLFQRFCDTLPLENNDCHYSQSELHIRTRMIKEALNFPH